MRPSITFGRARRTDELCCALLQARTELVAFRSMTASNPSSNAYPPFADETKIKHALVASGLPTQARVGALLRGTFDVDEE
jgi:hypothetical protein